MTPKPVLSDLAPYLHVADVQRSIDYYAYLGFEPTDVTLDDGVPVWALLVGSAGRLMVAQADGELDRTRQGVLLYLYTPDLVIMREELKRENVPVGEIENPDYLPNGVLRLEDPDGYVLLIAQI